MARPRPLSRRDFLKLSGTASFGLALSSCRSTPTSIATPTLTNAPSPTATPTPKTAPAATPEVSPTPDFPQLLISEVGPYAEAMDYRDTEVLDRVEITDLVDFRGYPFQAALDTQTSIPLLITDDEGNWQTASLRELAGRGGISVGQLLDWVLLEDSTRSQFLGTLLQKEFSFGLIGSGWRWSIQPDSPDSFNFGYEDRLIGFARQQGIDSFRLMHLIAAHRSELPDWLREGSFSRGELTQILARYIITVMTHFKGIVGEYVVVNEPYMVGVDPMIDDPFLAAIGPEYLDIAFQAARDADPSAKLLFNIWGNHWSRGPYTSLTRDLVDRLAGKGLMDKVGIQMHIDNTSMDVSPGDVESTIRSYGVPAAITEFDVDLRDRRGTPRERFAFQAQVYENMVGAALRAGSKDVGFWGAPDNLSWLENPEFLSSPDADPTMWDGDGNPKPAYYAVRKVLLASVGT